MNSPELNKVLVENIADLEVTATRLHMLGDALDGVIDENTQKWIDENNWSGEIDEGNWWIAPKGEGWYNPEDEESEGAFFEWTDFEDQSEDNYYVTQLCQLGKDKVGIRFVQDQIGRGQWKKIVSELAELVSGTGFLLEEKKLSFFLPVKIDQKVLASGLGDDDIEAGMKQYRETLDQLLKAKTAFDKVIARIKQVG
ncbi:hypothetical protein ACU81Q_06970 [Komagataeibacter melomenusus]